MDVVSTFHSAWHNTFNYHGRSGHSFPYWHAVDSNEYKLYEKV